MQVVGGNLLGQAVDRVVEVTVLVFEGRDPQLDGFDVEIHGTRKTCTVQESAIIAEFGDRVRGLQRLAGRNGNA